MFCRKTVNDKPNMFLKLQLVAIHVAFMNVHFVQNNFSLSANRSIYYITKKKKKETDPHYIAK